MFFISFFGFFLFPFQSFFSFLFFISFTFSILFWFYFFLFLFFSSCGKVTKCHFIGLSVCQSGWLQVTYTMLLILFFSVHLSAERFLYLNLYSISFFLWGDGYLNSTKGFVHLSVCYSRVHCIISSSTIIVK